MGDGVTTVSDGGLCGGVGGLGGPSCILGSALTTARGGRKGIVITAERWVSHSLYW